jgi:hypothetical protein
MDIKYVQLEPAAFLSDVQFIQMTMAERGIYWTLILLLYCNNGEIYLAPDKNDPEIPDSDFLRGLLGGYVAGYDESDTCIEAVMVKFNYQDGILTQKRVTEELKRSHNYIESGRKGAEKRWNRGANRGTIKGANANENETKVKKSNIRFETKESIPDKAIVSDSFKNKVTGNYQTLAMKLCDLFAITSKTADHTAICNLALKAKPEQYQEIIEIALKQLETPTIRNPIAALFAELKRKEIA